MRWRGGSTVRVSSLDGEVTNIKYPPIYKSTNNSTIVKKVLFFYSVIFRQKVVESAEKVEDQKVDDRKIENVNILLL